MAQITHMPSEQARVLFADDDPILAEFGKVHLASPTMTVESAANGEEAWRRLCSEPFDLLVLDIEMPVLDGFGLLERLRAEPRFEHLPIVMLTGREDVISIDRSFRLGAHSFSTKPINWAVLARSLRYVLRTSRIEADLRRQRRRSEELSQLTNDLLSLIRVEARTPLDTIIGYGDCIARQIDGPLGDARYVDYAEQIGAAARQMQERFIDLLQYAQLSSGHASLTPDEYRSRALIESAVAAVSPELSSRVDVDAQSVNCFVECDRYWLTRAMSHVVEDLGAHKCVERIGISFARTAAGEGVFDLVAHRAGCFAEKSGPNCSSKAAYSLASVRIGHGLGIPFARRIAELHGGSLDESEGAQGEISIRLIIPKSRLDAASSVVEIANRATAA